MTYRLFSLAIAVPLLLASPAAAQSREQRQMMADLRMLQQQTQRLEVTLGTLTDALQTVSQKLDAKLDAQIYTNRKTFADLKLLSDNISGDVRIVREKIDETNVRVGSLEQEVQAIQASIQTLRVAPPPTPALDAPTDVAAGGSVTAGPGSAPPVASAPPASAPTTAGPVSGASPGQAFTRAYGDYMAGQYTLAVLGFQAFLTTFPTVPDAARAQYYIGEAYRADSKLDQALAAYDKAIQNYPNASVDVAAAVHYKRGLVLNQLGRPDAAKAEFELVVKNYPNATEAGLARQRLEALLPPR